MKIEGENSRQLLSPSVSLSNSSTDEMIENENQTLRDRVGDLERKVLDQNDEIVCLRSTLADALRRISAIEGTKVLGNSERSNVGTPSKARNNGTTSAAENRDYIKRTSAYITGKGGSSSTPSSVKCVRKAHHYQSTSSLYSDGHSSSSASPAPSPSPTGLNNHHHQHQPHRYTSSFASSTPPPNSRPLQQPSLNKRWASTSDFNSPSAAAVAFSAHNSHHTVHNAASPSHTLSNKRVNTGSLHNLSSIRTPNHIVPRSVGRDAQYNSEEGILKFYLRGRPLNIHVPSNLKDSYHPQGSSSPPGAKLKLDWVYGYRGRDCRSNVHQLPTGEIVYFVAAVAVLYNAEEQTQRHYLGHTDDIKCLAVHPNKLTIASGQTAGHDRRDARSWRLNPPADPFSSEAEEWPHIRIWDSVSLVTLHVIGIGEIERSVACLSFSKSDGGGLLVAVDEAPDHNMSVWDWSRGERGFKLLETKCAADPVLAVDFSPVDRNTIIVCGKNHISFWTHDNGMLAKRVGIFENRERPKYVTSISFLNTGNVISGDSNGNLLVWQRGGNRVEKSVRGAHEGSIFSIFVQKDGTVITGGKDGKIIEWGREMKATGRVIEIPEHLGAPRVVTCGRGSRLIIGTTRNGVYGGNFSLPLQPLMQGHTEELWALTPHPSQNQFLTAGYDKTCYLWDSMARTIVWSKEIGEPLQCATFSKNGEIVLVGTTTGRWLVMDSETRELYSQHQDGSEAIQVLQYSPNGQYLAVGSRDNNIYIHHVSEDFRKYSRLGRCSGHSSFITHVDWSKDSQFIMSNSGDYEILYWNARLCKQVVQTSQMRDVEWETRFCVLSFDTIGIWGEGADGTDVNSATRANKRNLIATGDDFGKVKIFASPACYQKARFLEFNGHSSHVTSVRFLQDDTRLISTGGRDTAILQWRVTFSHILASTTLR